jgi:S1-C subfamily serine protease
MRLVDRPASTPGQSALVVQEVWDRWPADRAGLSPGDEVIAIDNHPIALVQGFDAALQASGNVPHLVRIRRAPRNVELQIVPMSPQVANDARPSLAVSDETGVLVDRVMKGSAADRAGLRPQDRILTLDGRPATVIACEQLFGKFTLQQPVTITIKRPGRRILVQVQP